MVGWMQGVNRCRFDPAWRESGESLVNLNSEVFNRHSEGNIATPDVCQIIFYQSETR